MPMAQPLARLEHVREHCCSLTGALGGPAEESAGSPLCKAGHGRTQIFDGDVRVGGENTALRPCPPLVSATIRPLRTRERAVPRASDAEHLAAMHQPSPPVDSSSQAGSGRGESQPREAARVELRRGQPQFEFIEREYEVRLARTPQELELAQRLRFEVFNRELGEGLRASEATGLDQDRFDSFCDHLLIIARDPALADGVFTRDVPNTPQRVVGTYRLQVLEVAEHGNGLYCDQEFDLSLAPRRFLEQGIELGRACIAKEHRRGHALFALFRGLTHYLVESKRRYLYGCCSLTGTDTRLASQAREWLDRRGKRHPEFFVPARGDYAVDPLPVSDVEVENFKLPQLFGTYLRYGALVCSEPAVDREFGTIDFLVQFDLEAFDIRLRRLFLEG